MTKVTASSDSPSSLSGDGAELVAIVPMMKDKDRHEGSSHHPRTEKKKCKKKRFLTENGEVRRRHQKGVEETDSRRKEARGDRDYQEADSRRKEMRGDRDHEEVDSRRKEVRDRYCEEADSRRKEMRGDRDHEEAESRRKETRGDRDHEEADSRRKEMRDRYCEEADSRRKEMRGDRDHEEADSRRKEMRGDRDHEEADSRRKEARGDRDYQEADSRRKEMRGDRDHQESDLRKKETKGERDHEGGTRKRCTKYRERKSEERRRDPDMKPKIKEEPHSDSELTRRERSRSPRNDRQRDDKQPSNLDQIMNVKEEKHEWGKGDDKEKKKPMENKAKPDFGLSGKLAEETNVCNGVLIKYSEPEEARKPKVRWRFYPFKGEESLPVLHLHRQSAYLVGRDRKIADLPVDHPSCSKQHAVLQYRLVRYTKLNGSQGKRVRPYIIDLESANGTFVNNNKIEPRKYVELLERDVIKFAFSSREYVLLHEHSKDEHLDDDVE